MCLQGQAVWSGLGEKYFEGTPVVGVPSCAEVIEVAFGKAGLIVSLIEFLRFSIG